MAQWAMLLKLQLCSLVEFLLLKSTDPSTTSQCHFYDLNLPNPTRVWNGSQSMAIERLFPLIVSMGNKVCVNKDPSFHYLTSVNSLIIFSSYLRGFHYKIVKIIVITVLKQK